MTTAWYTRYRPQTWGDVVGQEPVTTILTRAVAQDRVAHAYLFYGSRGTGKTTTARILSRAVNCLAAQSGSPCLQCRACQASLAARVADLEEIDAASNRGIDQIRSLRHSLQFATTSLRYKVILLDETHALTTDAANALLLTLEEPPRHVIFILATTEPDKLLATVRSRCQQHQFRRVAVTDITLRLSQIAVSEGLPHSGDSLRLIARSAAGSVRDAVGTLQKLAETTDLSDSASVAAQLGLSTDERVPRLVEAILSRQLTTALDLVAAVAESGTDLRGFVRALTEELRTLLLIKAKSIRGLALSQDELDEKTALASRHKGRVLARVAGVLARVDFQRDPYSPLPLELALIECMDLVKE